jgi:hypothetical protein
VTKRNMLDEALAAKKQEWLDDIVNRYSTPSVCRSCAVAGSIAYAAVSMFGPASRGDVALSVVGSVGKLPQAGIVGVKRLSAEGLAFELKHLPKHLEGTSAANRLIRKEGAAHVFESREALGAVEQAIMQRGQFTGSVRGWDRYGLQFDTPIGFRVGADGSRTPLFYGEIKVRDGMYHVIPRTGAGQ